MKRQLKDICTIKTGYFERAKDYGDVVYLQLNHFDEHGILIKELFPELGNEAVNKNRLLKKGDILYAAKGSKNFAYVVGPMIYHAIASTSFFILSLVDKNIYPEYIGWYLNTSKIQELLKSQSIGTAIPSISKTTLEDLTIELPNLEMQILIVKIDELRKKEKFLISKIQILKQKYINQIILKNLQ